MISVSLIDDDEKVIDFFRKVTLKASDVVCIRTASTVKEYLKQPILTKNPHFLFLDIHIAGETSMESIPLLLEKVEGLEVIMYSADEEFQQLMTAFKLGASGYIVKRYKKDYLKQFFEVLRKGGAAISPTMAKKLISSINTSLPQEALEKNFSNSEIQILNYLAEGWTYQFIADEMQISIDGVRYYIKKIYKKLNVKTRMEAVKVFRKF